MPMDKLRSGMAIEGIISDIRTQAGVLERVLREETDLTTSEAGEGDGVVLRCRKCKSTRVAVEQRQMRSADEGMSAFGMCMECKARWKL
jgi:DNA-directed RNA polymerase subunit M/transcription elongation factor TFIIS